MTGTFIHKTIYHETNKTNIIFTRYNFFEVLCESVNFKIISLKIIKVENEFSCCLRKSEKFRSLACVMNWTERCIIWYWSYRNKL